MTLIQNAVRNNTQATMYNPPPLST